MSRDVDAVGTDSWRLNRTREWKIKCKLGLYRGLFGYDFTWSIRATW